jgi:hypothetical protein
MTIPPAFLAYVDGLQINNTCPVRLAMVPALEVGGCPTWRGPPEEGPARVAWGLRPVVHLLGTAIGKLTGANLATAQAFVWCCSHGDVAWFLCKIHRAVHCSRAALSQLAGKAPEHLHVPKLPKVPHQWLQLDPVFIHNAQHCLCIHQVSLWISQLVSVCLQNTLH